MRNELELSGHRVGGRGSLGGEAPRINRAESNLDARSQLEYGSAEYAEVEKFFLDRLAHSERARARIDTIEKLNVPDIQDQ